MIKRPKQFHKPSVRTQSEASNLTALAALPSLGRTSAQMLIEVGVPDEAALKRLGPQACFRALRFRFGRRVSTNFIYALECAIRGIAWRALEPGRKTALRAAAQDIILDLEGAPPRKEAQAPQSRSGAPGGKSGRKGRASSTARAKDGRLSRRPR
jgi:TfoX C-terminal domain